MLHILVAAGFFACVAYLGVLASRFVCASITPSPDGPAPGNAPVPWLVAASALVGGFVVSRGAGPFDLGLTALVVAALVAAWCSDATCGLVPDVFTLGPLGAIVLFMLMQRQWPALLWATIPLIPFALAALFTHGRGMGWGDVKLSAFSGLVLGPPLALFALACACAVAVAAHRIKRLRPDQPIAFAPYISAAIVLALPLGGR
jgi:prepilin signal peptidase PulO-like enzyme (type II secretory pathway)